MKSLAIFLLTALLTATLVACGGGPSSQTGQQQQPQTPAQPGVSQKGDQTAKDQTPPPNPEFELARQVILHQGCGSCHTLKAEGLDLTGRVGPVLSNEASRKRSAEWLRAQISNPTDIPDSEVAEGFAGQQVVMPSFGRILSENEINALVAYMMSLNAEPGN